MKDITVTVLKEHIRSTSELTAAGPLGFLRVKRNNLKPTDILPPHSVEILGSQTHVQSSWSDHKPQISHRSANSYQYLLYITGWTRLSVGEVALYLGWEPENK
jgi:hypothetical protein